MEYLLYTCDDVVGLKGLPVILENFAIYRKARFGPNVACQLAGVVIFHHQCMSARLQDVPHFGFVEWYQVPDLQVIRCDTLFSQRSDGLTDDALGRAPADQRHLSVGRAKELWWWTVFEQPLHLAHALVHHEHSHFRVGELVADEHTSLIVLVASRDVRHALGARQGPEPDARKSESEAFVLAQGDTVGDRVAAVDRHIAIAILPAGPLHLLPHH